MSGLDVSQASMLDLFRLDSEEQVQVLTGGLLALERDAGAHAQLESCMRAAHSLKGAARIVGIEAGVNIAHTMESCFVAAQEGRTILGRRQIDALLRAVDLLRRIAQTPESQLDRWQADSKEAQACITALNRALEESSTPAPPESVRNPRPIAIEIPNTESIPVRGEEDERSATDAHDRVLRVTAQNLNRLLGLAGESLVESRWLQPFARSLIRLKRQHYDLAKALQKVRAALPGESLSEAAQAALGEAERQAAQCQQQLSQRMTDLEGFEGRVSSLAHRMYEGTLACRMRPFSDGTRGFPRMIRDLAHRLGKQVRLEIEGATTEIDRDVLEKLDAPLGHLLRNAVDHAIETPHERIAAGKAAEGVVRLKARHLAGRLNLLVSDDGAGIDLEKLRATVLARGLAAADAVARMSEAELYEFLLLPAFTLARSVTDISGRGVGLDAVQNMLKQSRGQMHISSRRGEGTRFELHLPLTFSLVRALLVEVSGEPYAVPLTSIMRAVKISGTDLELLEGRPHFSLDGRRIGLIAGHQVLESAPSPITQELAILVLGGPSHHYGLIVDRLLGERELVVQPLDTRLGKLKNIRAGALMEDGSPVLIVDSDDLLRSIEKLVASGTLTGITAGPPPGPISKRKRVLVIDDSLTVRELERKLLANSGYDVEVAVDGMDGWNAVRAGSFDLVVTDIDMPRMDGIELVTLLKQDPHLKATPVMIVSYKDRSEDRQRGLQAGADYYLAKSSFHDRALLDAVVDLIGGAAP